MYLSYIYTTGTVGSARPLFEHPVEHLSDDEAGRAHVDPVQRLAADWPVRVRVLWHGTQRRGPEAKGRTEKTARQRQCKFDFHHKTIAHDDAPGSERSQDTSFLKMSTIAQNFTNLYIHSYYIPAVPKLWVAIRNSNPII